MPAFLRQKRVLIPALLVALVVSTLFYGYHGDLSASLRLKGPPPPMPPGHNGGPPGNDRSPGGHPFTYDDGPDDGNLPPPPPVPHAEPSKPSSDKAEGGLWEDKDFETLEKRPYADRLDVPQDISKNRFPTKDERLRNEFSGVWRNADNMIPLDGGVNGLPRYKSPSREKLGDAEYLRQPIMGDFDYGADKAFLMFKTGADTMWKRMPPHFLTSLTRAKNFAIYSDAPGSIFGHEVVDILRDMPQSFVDTLWELKRYKAHLQSHDENWNWAPEKLKGDGGWQVDRFKNIPMLADAYAKNPNCDWYVWIDDDSFVFYDHLIRWLDTMNPNEYVYTGSTAGLSYNDMSFFFAHGGSVAVVSRAVAEALFGPEGKVKHTLTPIEFIHKWHGEAANICCGDALVAYMLIKELDVKLYQHPELGGEYVWWGGPFQGENIAGLIIKEDMCRPIITWHHLNAHDLEVLYEYERLWDHDRFVTYADIYRDFILPYVVEERPNWKISDTAGQPEKYPNENEDGPHPVDFDGETYHPSDSKEECKRLCEAKNNCMGWSFKKDFCLLSTSSFVFGAAANRWNEDEGWTTGYMVERIRQWRESNPCDPLQRDEAGNWNDNDSTSEGWMIRQLSTSDRVSYFDSDSTLPKF